MAETITVQIHGSEYKLRGDDASRIQEAASMVNEQMQYVSSKAPTQPISTIAVLAALNTAEMLMNEQERLKRESGEIVRRINSLTSTVEELLGLDP